MPGPSPKPAHLRQRANKKPGATVLPFSSTGKSKPPDIPNPDERVWHPLTLVQWANAWRSPMASQWLESDFDGLARLARLWDDYNRTGSIDFIKEIRLQSQAFGLTPLDRSRLQWEISKADEAEHKQSRRADQRNRATGTDPRRVLSPLK